VGTLSDAGAVPAGSTIGGWGDTTRTTQGQGVATPPRCAACGEPIRGGRAPDTFVHASRVIAACDLDADHPAVPDRPPGTPDLATQEGT
jgi:hypothetical protein